MSDYQDKKMQILKQLSVEIEGQNYYLDDEELADASSQLDELVKEYVIKRDEPYPDDLAFGESDAQEYERYGRNDLRASQRQVIDSKGDSDV